MKHILIKSATLCATLGISILTFASVKADTTTTSTTASIEVDGGGIVIDSLANINFGKLTIDGTEHNNINPIDPKVSTLTLHDYRGATKGWYLQASLETKNTLNGILLKLSPTADQGTSAAVTLNNDAQTINTVTTADLGKTSTNITLNPTMDIPAGVLAGNHSGTIDWNVVEGSPTV